MLSSTFKRSGFTQSLYHKNDQLYRFVLSILQYFYFVDTYMMFGQIFNF